MKAENKNFLYNVVYQMLIYVFPLITIPYISRVLGARNIGIYSYTYSIVNCLMLFGMLGINNYGNREISKVRDDKKTLSKTFLSIYYLQIIISTLMCIGYLIYLLFFCEKYKMIFFIQFISLLSVCFDINWFYFGLEKFKMTINRNLFIKIFSMVLIFMFVKAEKDLWKYTLIMSFSTLISQLYLILKLKNNIIYQKISFKNIFSHLKSCLILFIPVLSYTIYKIMDKTMIGSISSVLELGYYESAEKIINIPISVINALGTVMLPHMAYVLKKSKKEYKKKIFTSMELVMILSVSMTLGLILVADDASKILFGFEYVKSGNIMRLLSITIIASAWANVIRTQYLIPMNKDKIYVFSTIIGAILNLISNIIFINLFGAYGACIGTIIAEIFVTLYQSYFTKNELEIKKYFYLLLKSFFKATIIFIITFSLTFFITNIYLRFALQITIYVIIFFIIYKNYIMYEFFGRKKGVA